MDGIPDFHSHYAALYYSKDLFTKNLSNKGIDRVCVCSTRQSEWDKVLQNSGNENILPFIGTHPWFLKKLSDDYLQKIEIYLEKFTCGIGEVGLDFKQSKIKREDQITYLREVLALAEKYKRPVNLHCIKAENELYKIIKEINITVPIICHASRFSPLMHEKLAEYDTYFSYSLNTLRYAKVQKSLQQTSLDKIVFESDYEEGGRKDIKGAYGALQESLNLLDFSLQEIIEAQNKTWYKIRGSFL